GGLVGWNLDAAIDSCSVTGTVSSSSGTVGGLVGFDQDIISNCHTSGRVIGGTVGGLVGYKEFGKIINCSALDTVQSTSGTAGGLVGAMYQAEIQNSHASGSVTGFRYTGGFAGKIQYRSKITNCYVRSDVTGSAPSAYNATGGFCGYVNGYGINLGSNIENCFSTSLVHYTGTTDPTDRGFVGMVALTNTFINNFFVVTSSSQLTDAAGAATPKDSIAMSDVTTFTDISTEGLTSAWDFAYNFNDDAGDDDIWDMDTSGAFNDGYPFLFWENGDDIALQEEVGIADQNGMISEFKLLPAYPNPFNPKTVIGLHYAVSGNSVINIYNVQGILVEQLFNDYIEAGSYKLTWDASDMSSGVYIVRMVAGDFIQSQKVVLIK
ncbi:MAG: T9SS type A sorting domain-containing protein, partial [Candidatus Marinimicrobia bacterium]|nr:T9SS type A sorting domain-containing protein [Candidatus Neomarinimicrobiota bacterium]